MPQLMPLADVLAMAESTAHKATLLATAGVPTDALTESRTHAAVSEAFSAASRAWSEYAIARMRAGDNLDPAPTDPRDALRRRAGQA